MKFIIAMIKICNVICGYVYYKKIVMPHTIANKITGFILFIVPILVIFYLILPIEKVKLQFSN